MNYDVQIGSIIHRGIPYVELIMLPIEADTFVRRENGEWIHAKNCVELTHILAQHIEPSSVYSTHVDNYLENEDYDIENSEESTTTHGANYYSTQSAIHVQPQYQYDDIEEERIFIPNAEYFKCKQKRKAAVIGVCTLGLAGLSLMGIDNTWRSNIFEGTSFSANAGIGFVLKCLSFCLLTAIIAFPYFLYSVFALIYYSIRLNNLKR